MAQLVLKVTKATLEMWAQLALLVLPVRLVRKAIKVQRVTLVQPVPKVIKVNLAQLAPLVLKVISVPLV